MERALAAALSQAVDSVLSEGGKDLSEQIERDTQELGRRIAKATSEKGAFTQSDVRRAVTDSGWLLVPDAFSVEDLPETPTGFLPVPGCDATMRARLAALGLHGLMDVQTVAYKSENEGALFVNLVALPGSGRMAEKSINGMSGHTDAVSFPFPGTTDPDYPRIAPSPDFVTLAGLRNPNDVATNVMPLAKILERLDSAHIAELEKGQFVIQCQDTFRAGTQRILGVQHILSDAPVLHTAPDGSLVVRFSHSKVVADHDNEDANRARDAFVAACAEVAVPIALRPGSLLVINNRRALHGREFVGPGHGEQTRWLLRTYALESGSIQLHSRYTKSAYQLFP